MTKTKSGPAAEVRKLAFQWVKEGRNSWEAIRLQMHADKLSELETQLAYAGRCEAPIEVAKLHDAARIQRGLPPVNFPEGAS
ncbi:hypothetical protein GCM10022631_26440 [Deinococcus rubellus]|uniref:hypothetical protein n=1 Tax=Deinococcus rubellus TaxID=1889240 RepID=UPI0031EA41F9